MVVERGLSCSVWLTLQHDNAGQCHTYRTIEDAFASRVTRWTRTRSHAKGRQFPRIILAPIQNSH